LKVLESATWQAESGDEAVSTNPAARYVPYEQLVPGGGPNGQTCTRSQLREVPASEEVGDVPPRTLEGLRIAYPACPVEPGSEPVPETPGTYALRYWKDLPLPAPQPYIAPGRAITGLDAYLETRGTTTHTYNEADTPFGALTIVATGKYYVDWGDGTTTGPHSREGKPWPDGEIKHQYINIGSYDVVVTERWTARWSFGSASGTLDELRTVGRIEDFPVGQIQAVVYQ